MATKKRSVAFVVILSLITSGIYPIYWFVQTSRELRELTNSDKPKLKYFILGMCLYVAGILAALIGQFIIGGAALAGMSMAASGSEAAGLTTMCCGAAIPFLIMGGLLMAGAVFSLIFQWQHAKAISIISKEQRSAGGLFALWLFFAPVAYAFSQIELNKYAGATPTPSVPIAPATQEKPASAAPVAPPKPTPASKPAPKSKTLPLTPTSTPKKPAKKPIKT